MPGRARLINEKQVYHVMLRGNNRENIFIDDENKIAPLAKNFS